MDDDPGFGSPEVMVKLEDRFYDTGLDNLSSGTYYWKVRSDDGIGESEFSGVWNFTLNAHSYCGDDSCDSDENCSVCEEDCGMCEPETYCGDGICNGDEDCSTCSEDCGSCSSRPYCGDGICNSGETCLTCAVDCGSCSGHGSSGSGSPSGGSDSKSSGGGNSTGAVSYTHLTLPTKA